MVDVATAGSYFEQISAGFGKAYSQVLLEKLEEWGASKMHRRRRMMIARCLVNSLRRWLSVRLVEGICS